MRLEYPAAMPEAVEAMQGLQNIVEGCGLGPKLLQLVKLRERASLAWCEALTLS